MLIYFSLGKFHSESTHDGLPRVLRVRLDSTDQRCVFSPYGKKLLDIATAKKQ